MTISEEDKKTLKIVGGIAIGGFILFSVFGKKTESTPDPTGNGNYIPTQNVFSAQKVANGLWNAMKDMGTDEDAIIEILKPVTQQQFGQVVSAFGKVNYNTTTGNQYSFDPFTPLPKLGLKDWLFNELSGKEYAILRYKYPYYL